jgi:hypothetical protein
MTTSVTILFTNQTNATLQQIPNTFIYEGIANTTPPTTIQPFAIAEWETTANSRGTHTKGSVMYEMLLDSGKSLGKIA